MRTWKKLTACLLLATVAGCSSLKQDKTVGWSAEELYQAAKSDLNAGGYMSAIDYYTKLLSRYPYGTLAQQSMLDMAYAYYKSGEPKEALAQFDEFIRTYPQHPYIDYALYMKGVVEYEKNINFFDRIVPLNLSETDPNNLLAAFDAFKAVVDNHPTSPYAEDSRFRMVFIRNLLAQHELSIADFYLSRGAYIASINRAQSVLANYEQTPSAPYALAILVRAYQEINDTQLSNDVKRVLQSNFPDLFANDKEIQHYLTGDVSKQKSFFARFSQKPKT